MDKIIALPQFEKLEKHRKNAKHPVLKEEERVVGILKSLHQEKRIDDKADTPMRPVLPGSGGKVIGLLQIFPP